MITTITIFITSIISFYAFKQNEWLNKLTYVPTKILAGEWYRLFSHSFVHANFGHLFFNMFSLYLFGKEIESIYVKIFGGFLGISLYFLLYLISIILATVPSYINHYANPFFKSLGASGGVSGIIFAYTLVYPMHYLGVLFIPVYLPAFIFAAIFVVVSILLETRQQNNINHMTHITGGLVGAMYMFLVFKFIGGINLINWFVQSIRIDSIKDIIKIGF